MERSARPPLRVVGAPASAGGLRRAGCREPRNRHLPPLGADGGRPGGRSLRHRFPSAELEEIAEEDSGPSVLSNASDGGLTAELPFYGATPSILKVARGGSGPETALFTASLKEAHPRYGSGCLMRLRLPLSSLDGPAVNDLNRAEAEGAPTYGFGAWCVQDGTPVYALFLPNALYRPGLMKAMTMGAFGRCMGARDFLGRYGRASNA